ncbi:hypothetical protein [Rhizobium sp. CF142]|uniref:hypothetical protein n=1 Tax=Rhizobium sp. CF142 TaxID=1144314 RepID=UPI001FCC2421|nr:hypothetical protein [Rhizobium sp. CF142]
MCIFSRVIVFVIVVLMSHSRAVGAMQEIAPIESPPNRTAPWEIEWSMPDLKDETTPKTLVVCSEHVNEQIRQYRSLIEKATVLKGYTILDGNELNAQKRAADNVGYIVFINQSADNKALSDCIEKYPDLKPIVTHFIQTNIPDSQKTMQTLIQAGALPAGMPPSQCMSRFYYPTEDYYPTREQHQRWVAHVGIAYSSDEICLESFLPSTFGIDPDSCQSAGICR